MVETGNGTGLMELKKPTKQEMLDLLDWCTLPDAAVRRMKWGPQDRWQIRERVHRVLLNYALDHPEIAGDLNKEMEQH